MDTSPTQPLIFLSYSAHDGEIGGRLAIDLRRRGIRIWTDLGGLRSGGKWEESIREAIRSADGVILIASPSALSSHFVRDELSVANMYLRPVYPFWVAGSSLLEAIPLGFGSTQYLDARGDKYEEAATTLAQLLTTLPGAERPQVSDAQLDKISTIFLSIPIRIVEKPLKVYNFITILSALSDLSVKYWLIERERFADLIEYTQTRTSRLAEEANVLVTQISYNSPMNMEWKVDLSAPSVAEALVTTIDGIVQVRKRLERLELENQTKAQEIKQADQQADQEQQTAAFEREKQQLAIEQQRLALLEKRLEVQKKGIEYALEIANKVVDTLHPNADSATRAMEIQALLPNLLQLQNGKGLELALPTQDETQEK